jgi:pimeloyl-ACP methyl ester carboxylesterase
MYILLAFLVIVLSTFAIVIVTLWFSQDRYIFFPQPPSLGKRSLPAGYRWEELALTMSDNTRLEAWLVMPVSGMPPLLIYFGGNAEEASCWIDLADRYEGCAVLLVNYRGYGRSQGEPGERALFADALEIYDQISRRQDIDTQKVILHGNSLGSGVAVFLASQRPVRSVILTAPYDSIRSMAKEMFPYLPVSMILRHPFDSLSRAPTITMPLLCLVARQDDIIPIARSRRLFNAWAGQKIWREIANAGHNTIGETSEYWQAISEFLRLQKD